MDVQVAPVFGHSYELDPERPGLRAVMEGEEHHHEKKPVLKKVKEKVKKIKETISKKRHSHDHNHHEDHHHEDEDEDYEEVDDEEGYGDTGNDERREDMEVHAGVNSMADVEKAPIKDFVGRLEEDPAAPTSDFSTQTNRVRGGEEIGMSPVIQSFEDMVISDQPAANLIEEQKGASYTETISATAKAAYEKAAEAGAAVVEKVVTPVTTGVTGSGRDKVMGVREKLAEKLKPGEQDKALFEVISDAIQRRKTAAPEQVVATDSSGDGERVGLMGRLGGVTVSWVGGWRRPHASPPFSEQQMKESGDWERRDPRPHEIGRQENKDMYTGVCIELFSSVMLPSESAIP